MSAEKRPPGGPSDFHVEDFLRRLRRILDERGLSQARLARELQVGEATVSEWFTRRRVPHGDVFLRLPDVLSVNGHWLLTGNGPMEDCDPGGDAFRTGAREVLERLRRFHEDEARRYESSDPEASA